MIVLAGDIGATQCRLALFRDGQRIFEQSQPSRDFASLEAAVERFLADARKALGPDALPTRACLGVPGPVQDDTSRVTNLPWFADARKIESRTKIERVSLINDFQAVAVGVTAIGDEHLVPLGGGARDPRGAIAVTGPGTGLGTAFLFWSPGDARHVVVPSEGGHVDFTPRSALENGLMSYMAGRYGRVSYERVLSSQGLVDIFGFLTSEPAVRPQVSPETRAMMVSDEAAQVITRQALAERDPICVMAVNVFCSILGGLAGNLALTFLAKGGVFISGGIAPRIAPIMQNGVFRQAFEAKGRFQPLVAQVPCFLITHPSLGLVGAAARATQM